MESPKNIFSYRKFWAHRFGTASFLPMSRSEMTDLGWDSCDIILVTGDAYIDHPSFGMALIGRLLEAQGFRVGIIAQPDWHNVESFKILGKPNLFFGVTSGNLDSMVNHYTADRKIRSNDAYTPDGIANKRPNRAVIVYSQRCREAYPETPIVLGGIESSLRRIAHYDYWSDKVRRSILVDAKADILIYGNAERALIEFAHRIAKRETVTTITDIRGTAIIRKTIPEEIPIADISNDSQNFLSAQIIRLPSFEKVSGDPLLYAQASRAVYLESNPYNARSLIQAHGDRYVWINPPPFPLSTEELDQVYALPFARLPHPNYNGKNIPAYEMIKFSVNILRGCFGGCSFCALAAHEGRIVQNRSTESILQEITEIKTKTPGFTGVVSDLGGPTANMYNLSCKDPKAQAACRKLSCIYPDICKNLNTNHGSLIQLYREARDLTGIKKIVISSGLRYDLAIKSPEYVKELATYHVGGYLKIAPEHISPGPLAMMQKPGITVYNRFKELFTKYSESVGKEQYLIPYFIAAHPGATDEDMLELAIWLKTNNYRLDQVQNFLPTPMTLATTMYHTGFNPLGKIERNLPKVIIPKSGKTRRLHKAFLRYHDPINWPLLRQALRNLGRADLIGNGKRHLIPTWQPKNRSK